MKFTAGETVTIEIENDILEVKIEDASKGDVVSGRVENVLRGQTYKVGEVYEFDRANLKSRDN
jgi:hypothetical protein